MAEGGRRAGGSFWGAPAACGCSIEGGGIRLFLGERPLCEAAECIELFIGREEALCLSSFLMGELPTLRASSLIYGKPAPRYSLARVRPPRGIVRVRPWA